MEIPISASRQGKVRGTAFTLPPETITKLETMLFKTLKNSNDSDLERLEINEESVAVASVYCTKRVSRSY